ncbi:MAG TPA: protein kinase, partial [Gemmata sp.]|nr:protein kinase [Gemmata sp.]
MEAIACAGTEELELLVTEQLAGERRSAIEAHLETCAACQEKLERLLAPTTEMLRSRLAAESQLEPDKAFLERLRALSPISLAASTVPNADAHADSSADDRIPRRIGPYEILSRIGRGGMGAIYKARHRDLDKIVAVKVLSTQSASPLAVTRFRTEMKAVGRLDHPNIVAGHDAGQEGEIHYLVMDLVDGLDLARLVERTKPLPIAEACELARQAAVGLCHAHDRGLVHRDVKPSNLILARGGVVKVLDLGLARLCEPEAAAERATASRVLLGTADYVAPEQIGGAQNADGRADIYGLGATLYFLLAGTPPFGGEKHSSWLEKLRAHQQTPVPPIRDHRPDVPAALAGLVERMLAKEPAHRPATMAEVVEQLQPYVVGANLPALLASSGVGTFDPAETQPLNAQVVGVYPPTASSRARKNAWLCYAVLGLTALAAGVFLVVYFPRKETTPAPPARILAVEARQFRGVNSMPIGVIGVDHRTIELNDSVRFTVKLSAPAYCYLIAFNPDGKDQLCYPEAESEQEARGAIPHVLGEVRFPADSSKYFVLDQAGIQAFVVIASSRPLPAYREWLSLAGAAPWPKQSDRGDPGGVWRYDGASWGELISQYDLRPVS